MSVIASEACPCRSGGQSVCYERLPKQLTNRHIPYLWEAMTFLFWQIATAFLSLSLPEDASQ